MSALEIRRSSLSMALGQTQQFDLLEIIAAPTPERAVVLVLDLSDSCGPLSILLARLPALFARLPRKWPVWVYCLSNQAPIANVESINVGHIVDGSVDLSTIVADRTRRQIASACGSFIAPVIETVHERRAIEGFDEAMILILTDGKLTDFSPPAVSPALRIAGLTENIERSSDLTWRQALPKAPLFRLNDSDLDSWMGANQEHANHLFAVTFESDRLKIIRQLKDDGSLNSATPFEWDSRSAPIRLLSPSDATDSLNIILRSKPSGPVIRLNALMVKGLASDQASAAAIASLQPALANRDSLISCGFGETGFEDLWKAAAALASCCDRNRKWQEMLPVTEPILRIIHATPECHAAVCVCVDDPAGPIKQTSRVEVIGLKHVGIPAISWNPMQSIPFGPPTEDWRIRYDKMEGRWLLARNGEERELSPNGSQRLGILKLETGNDAHLLFSGDL